MKIALVLSNIPAYSETFFNNKIKGLQENGFEVTLFVIHKHKKQTHYTQKVISIYSGNKFEVFVKITKAVFYNVIHFKKALNLYQLNKKDGKSTKETLKNNIENGLFLNQKTDWLHFGFGTIALGRENVGKVINAKTAVSFRGHDIGIYPINNPNCYDLLWKKIDKIHVISNDIANLILKNGFTAGHKIIKITPAINTNFFKPKTNHNPQFAVPNFTTIARLHWKKGLEYTLEALTILKDKGVDFHYTIIGNGSEKERLQFAIHQLELSDHVIFTGKLNQDEIKKQLEKSDIYLQYSIQEGFCNSVLEAQAMGKICIVSNAEGLSENVSNEKTGFVVEKRNPKALANKILEVIKLSENDKLKISKAAIGRVENEFTIEKQIQKFIAFYEN
jgi:glycosyltransferase involved in cell wall biosynthesis